MNINKRPFIKTGIFIVIVIAGTWGFIYGLAWTLKTPHPLQGVRSGSMSPTIEAGDLIVIRGVAPSEIEVRDVIVFHQPNLPKSVWGTEQDNLIIHRVVRVWEEDGELYFKTQGDNNPSSISWEERIPAECVVGEWTGIRIPVMGWVFLFLQSPLVNGISIGTTLAIILIIFLLFSDYLIPEEKPRPPAKETSLKKVNKVEIVQIAYALYKGGRLAENEGPCEY